MDERIVMDKTSGPDITPMDELEHLHRELELVLDWEMDWTTDANAPTYGLLVRRMAAIEWAMQLPWVSVSVGRWSQRKLRVTHPDDAYARGYDQARLDAAVMISLNHPDGEAALDREAS